VPIGNFEPGHDFVENIRLLVVLFDRSPDRLAVLLVGELRRVDTDHHQFLFVFLLEELQVGQHVHAVDAAVGPEVEYDDLAAEVLEVDLAAGGDVEPPETPFEAGGCRSVGERVLGRRLLLPLVGRLGQQLVVAQRTASIQHQHNAYISLRQAGG